MMGHGDAEFGPENFPIEGRVEEFKKAERVKGGFLR